MTTATSPAVASLASQIAASLRNILRDIFETATRRYYRHPVRAAVILPLQILLNQTLRRMERLLARLAAGKLPKPRRCRPRGPLAAPRRPPALPRETAWLRHELGWEVAGSASQLEHLLARPEVAAMLAQDPAALRILAPVRRMLGSLPPKPRAPRPPRQRQPRPKPPRPAASGHRHTETRRPGAPADTLLRLRRAIERARARLAPGTG